MNNKAKIFVWSLFDFANTSFSIVVVTFVFAVYFKEEIASGKSIGDLYWSFSIGISMLITALISPILGAIADFGAGKKRFLLFFTLLCIISTAMLYFTGKDDIAFAMMLFITANVGFEAGLVFYDAYLPEITSPKNYGRVSGYGFGMGYLGSLVILALLFFFFISKDLIKESFPFAALFFLIFATPIFLFLKDSRKKVQFEKSYLKIGFERVKNTIKSLKNYKNLAIFLLAFFFYVEGVNTVIFFSGNYAKSTIGFNVTELTIFFITVQSTAILGSVFFGIIGDSIGQKKAILISLFIWIFTVLIAYFITDKSWFYLVGLLAGSVMGATQSTSRSLMSKLTPAEKKTEFFGFYSFFGKSSAIIGPLVFGFVSYITESQRFAILSIAFFFIAGIIILLFVNDPKVQTSKMHS